MMNKTIFLDSITSKTGNYKRVTDTPLRYAGGKSLAIGALVEQIPKNVTHIVSPFIGGGSFEVVASKRLGLKVEGYDIFNLLVNYWQHQIKDASALADILLTFEPTKEHYTHIKQQLKAHWIGETLITDTAYLAAAYYFNHNTSYGPGFLGWPSSVYMDAKRWANMIEKVRNFNAPTLNVSAGSFTDSISNAGDAFIYADPPYYLGGDSKMFKGIYPQRNFPVHHEGFDHKALRDLLHNHKGGFMLSYNDCTTIREWYADFDILTPSWQYTMGQGETRIGKNRLKSDINHIKQSHELLIVKRG